MIVQVQLIVQVQVIVQQMGGYFMEAKSYSAVRNDMANVMEQVCNDHAPVIITRKNANSVVMMSLEDYNAIEETAYLLRSPANAERLRESIKQAAEGNVIEHELIEERKAQSGPELKEKS